MLLLQIVLYCLLFVLLVKCAAGNSGLNCLYFYPKEYIAEAQKRGLADRSAVMKKGRRFMLAFCAVMLAALLLILSVRNRALDFRTAYLQSALLSCGHKLVRRDCRRPPLGRSQPPLAHCRHGGRSLCQAVEGHPHKARRHRRLPDSFAPRRRPRGAAHKGPVLSGRIHTVSPPPYAPIRRIFHSSPAPEFFAAAFVLFRPPALLYSRGLKKETEYQNR